MTRRDFINALIIALGVCCGYACENRMSVAAMVGLQVTAYAFVRLYVWFPSEGKEPKP